MANHKFYYKEDSTGTPSLFWVNPWNGREERLAAFYWPTHEPDKTRLVEEFYELMGSKCADAANEAWQQTNQMSESI